MKKIIAYGAGAAFRNYLKSNKIEFLFAIDNNIECESIENIKIFKFEDVKKFLQDNKGQIYIYIFVMSSKANKEIKNHLLNIGLSLGADFDEYSVLLKNDMRKNFEEHGIYLKENTYEFTKSLFDNLNIENQSSVLGTWIFLELLNKTKGLKGDIIELGVYRGGNAYYSSLFKMATNDNRKYYLVDSFEGFNEYSEFDPIKLKDMFKDNSYEDVKILFKDFEKSIVIKGYIPEILENFKENKISIIYYDCDTYESCKQTLRILYPKLQKNGYIILHDYEVKKEGFVGVKRAVDEYLKTIESKNIDIINIPETTHIILKKL